MNSICLPRVTGVLFVRVQGDARVTGHTKAATVRTERGFRLPLLCRRGIGIGLSGMLR